MDKVIAMLHGAILVAETDIEMLNMKLETGDYPWGSSKKHIEEEIEEERMFIKQLRKAIKKLDE